MQLIIVGAGLFGSIAATLARKAGHQVTLVDNAAPLAASPCSGNLFKRSWTKGLGAERAEGGYAVLRRLYGITRLPGVELDYVPLSQVLVEPDLEGTVAEVGDGYVKSVAGNKLTGHVLVAAGVHCDQLVKMPAIRRLLGASLRIKGQLKQPALKLYAPYKHAIAYNVTNKEIWAGDGAAILEKNWNTSEREGLLRQRISKFFGLRGAGELRVGARPYVPGHHGYFAKVYPRTWVSTGGAKNGLVLAAYQAQLFLESL